MSITRIRGGLQVKDGSVLTSDIANGAITSEKLSVGVLGAHSASSLETATGAVVVALSANPTAGQILVATSPTNATWQTVSGVSGVAGTGTSGTVALWTGTAVVGDSLLSQTGGVVTLTGQLKVTGGTPGAGKVLTSDAAGLATWATPTSSQWVNSGSNIYFSAGNVAIGTTPVAGIPLIIQNTVAPYSHLKLMYDSTDYLEFTFTSITSARHLYLNATAGYGAYITGDFFDVKAGAFTVDQSGNAAFTGSVKIAGGSPGVGKVLTSDAVGLASWVTPASGGITFVDLVTPTGVVDGVNAVFTLPSTPAAGSLHFYVNGVLQQVGGANDYTLSGAVVTMTSAPSAGSTMLASYRL